MNNVNEIQIKKTYYFFEDMTNIKILDQNKIKINEKSHTNIFFYYIGHLTTNRVTPLYFTINKINEYIEKSKGNKYKDTNSN